MLTTTKHFLCKGAAADCASLHHLSCTLNTLTPNYQMREQPQGS